MIFPSTLPQTYPLNPQLLSVFAIGKTQKVFFNGKKVEVSDNERLQIFLMFATLLQ